MWSAIEDRQTVPGLSELQIFVVNAPKSIYDFFCFGSVQNRKEQTGHLFFDTETNQPIVNQPIVNQPIVNQPII